jgi:hypothetical protein
LALKSGLCEPLGALTEVKDNRSSIVYFGRLACRVREVGDG